MKVVVTGVNGQVGGAMVKSLAKLGTITVLPADRAILDLSRPNSLAETLDRLSPEIIINPAAYTAVDRAEDEQELAYTVNARSPGAMATWAAKRGVPIVHFSTDYVFDGESETAWREDSPTGPLSIYGASKLAGEDAVRSAGGAHLIVRTSWVYGARGTNFLRTIARLSQERTELKIVADQVGAPTSAPIIAANVATLLTESPTRLLDNLARTNGIINIAAAGTTSWHGFAVEIVNGLRARGVAISADSILPLRTEQYPTKARRPRNSTFDLTRLRDIFNIAMPAWRVPLSVELDLLAREMMPKK